jgi:ABC-type transport system involved in multi-copper enzyme maturation permease subunit
LRPGAFESFRWLTAEALREAARRRIVVVIVGLSLLSLAMIDGCSSCASGTMTVNETVVDPSAIGGAVGVAMLSALCLWIVILAGVLCADQLARTVSEGSVWLWLARPVSRESFVLSQLAGSLGIAWAAGGVLLATAASLLAARQGLATAPALAAGASAFLNAVTLGAISMAASLWLPRAAIALLVLGITVPMAALEGVALAGLPLEGVPRLVAELGPPFLAAPLAELSAWSPQLAERSVGEPILRAAVWAAASVALLLALFRRVELRD